MTRIYLLTPRVGLEHIVLDICSCAPAAVQLVGRGLFPCSPIAPTLAVDLQLLQFARQLFLRMPPNVTGFTETMEAFFCDMGYKLVTRVRVMQYYHITCANQSTGYTATTIWERAAVVWHTH